MKTAKFYKVSYQQFEEAYLDYDPNASREQIQNIYEFYSATKTCDKRLSWI